MAWWTDILFFKDALKNRGKDSRGKPSLAVLNRAPTLKLLVWGRTLRQYFYKNFIDILYVFLSIFTYLYLAATIYVFFFQKSAPHALAEIIETLSEPYLGALGVYVVVKEIERRRGKKVTRRWGELFTVIWFFFFISATALTYVSENYEVGGIYKTVVTNALASLIIRIGTLLK